jgi:hypothetical protein
MKVGDLVELRTQIHHVSGVYGPGAIGMIVMIDDRVAHDRVEVMLENEAVGCHRRELEVINESC